MALHDGVAGVDGHRYARYVTGPWADQPQHGLGDILRLDQRHVGQQHLRDGRVGFSSIRLITKSLMIIGVATPLGLTELTRILCGAYAFAADRISPTTPCLDAA